MLNNPFKTLILHKELIMQMTKRDIIGRYKGSALGLIWSFLHPIVLLVIYTVVFGFVFKAKWGIELKQNFALVLFSGLIFHSLLSECLVRAPTLIIHNVNYVKKVVFPLEIFSWVLTLSSIFHFLVSAVILMVAQLFLTGYVNVTWLFLPLVLLPMLFICLGLCWLLSALSVYLRDVTQVTTILSTVVLFLCPIFYPINMIPERYQSYIYLNPLTLIVEQSRKIIIFGNTPDFLHLFIFTFIALVFMQFSYYWFLHIRKGFADVL